MKISTKLVLGFLLIILLMTGLTMYSFQKSQDSLSQAVGNSSMFLAREMLNGIDRAVYHQSVIIQSHMNHSNFQKAVADSNKAFEKLANIQEFMDLKDQEWKKLKSPSRDISSKEIGLLTAKKLMSRELSLALEKEFINFYEEKQGQKIFGEILVTNKYGAIVAQTHETKQYRHDNEIWWKKARAKETFFSDILYQENIDSHGIELGIPILDDQENFMGVVKAFLFVQGIVQKKMTDKKKYKTTQIRLFSKTGKIIYGSREFIPLEDLSQTLEFQKIKGPDSFSIAEINGQKKLCSHVLSQGYEDFKGLGWILCMDHDAEEVFAPVTNLRNKLGLMGLILICMGVFVCLLLTRSIVKPLTRLVQSAEIIGTGDLDHRIKNTTRDETGDLGKAFNVMLEKLQSAESKLKKNQANLESLVKERTLSLENTNRELAGEARFRKKQQEKIIHLNAVLKALRSINQLIISEMDQDKLIQKACDILIETRGYNSAWIALFDEKKELIAIAQSGVDDNFLILKEFLEKGKGIICNQKVLEQPEMRIIKDPSLECIDCCPLAETYKKSGLDLSGMHLCLQSDTSVFGILSVSLPTNLVQDREEQSLFNEIANDIAFALKTSETKTQKKELEAQFLQAQKMESIGTLAGGVAHDFNNILSIIIGNSEMALDEADPNDPLHGDLEEILKAGKRGAALTRQLLAFSRKQVIQPANINLNTIIENLEKMIVRMLGEDIVMHIIPGQDLGLIMADVGQMEQIIMNLAANARDAMPRGGEIFIETADIDLKPDFFLDQGIKTGPKNHATPFVMLKLTDTGTGMDKEIQKRIFEPFFTTKARGRGTGLGLSTVYGIVKQNNGFIFVESELNKGTVFKIFFPGTQKKETTMEKTEKASKALGGNETILVVEDDDMLRKLTSRVLKSMGYKVLDASNGENALETAQMHKEPIDLMLTDMIMPGMSGSELAESISVPRPDMKLIYTSGYIDNPLVLQSIKEKKVPFLQKPFSLDKLMDTIRQVLDK